MFSTSDKWENRLDIKIGEQDFHLFFDQKGKWLCRNINEKWREYRTEKTEKGCRVEVCMYRNGRIFDWQPSERDAFRRYFEIIHQRFPSAGGIENNIKASLRGLQHLDPGEERIRHIHSCMDGTQRLIYTGTGFDHYFFDTETDTAFFFIRKRIRRSHMVPGIVNGIMFLLSHYLIHKGGVLLHAAAVHKDDTGVLFLGLSGAGKSTIVSLCRPDACFSDDGVVVKKEEESFYAYRSPFRQVNGKEPLAGLEKGEIRKIFLLKKGQNNKVFPIKQNQVMQTILHHMIHFYKYLNNDTAQMGFWRVKEIIDTLPVYKLRFAKTENLWDNIMSATGGEKEYV